MNKHCYRIIFNRSLGLLQVVPDIARRRGSSVGRIATATGSRYVACMRPVAFASCLALGLVSLAFPAQAQIVADHTAPGNQQPTVLEAANGVPQVNIQTPSAAGVSRNTYQQFDVEQQGAILNNARTATQTQLGGWVQGNPWLAKGSARIILNEVNASDPSRLQGYVEVAGERAQVVIANPAGITCDGCGFINTQQATLTTGTPVMQGGALDGYRVAQGAIDIQGKGLDASSTDYTRVIARSVKVNAGLWAKELQVTTGVNEVSADQGSVKKQAAQGDQPAFALDVGSLGGMYAQKIVMVGTEHGVGVRNAGTLGAEVGELVVTADGRLENSGTLQAMTDTRLDVQGGMANRGTLSAQRELLITTVQDVDNSKGKLNARRVAVQAQSLTNREGVIEQTGAQELTLHAAHLSNRAGKLGSTSTAPTVQPEQGASSGQGGTGTTPTQPGESGASGATPGSAPTSELLAKGELAISGTLDNDDGRLLAGGELTLAATSLDNREGVLEVAQLTVAGGDVDNRQGMLRVNRDAQLTLTQLNNEQGQLHVTDTLALSTDTLNNRAGLLQHAGSQHTRLEVTHTLDNTGGTLASNAGALTLETGMLVNADGTLQHTGEAGLTIKAGELKGAGGHIATPGAATLRLGKTDHRHATLTAKQLDLQAERLDNLGGSVRASGNSASTIAVAHSLDNSEGGEIASQGTLTIEADALDNTAGRILHAGDKQLTIKTKTLLGTQGKITSNGALHLTGDDLTLARGTTTAREISIDTATLDNTGGELVAGGGPLLLNARGAVTNQDGKLLAKGPVTVTADALDNQGGQLVSTDEAMALAVVTTLNNSHNGLLAAKGDLSISAATLDNREGTIEHAGTGTLTLNTPTLVGNKGKIASNGALALTGDDLILVQGTTSAKQVTIDTGTLDNTGGELVADSGKLQLTARGAVTNKDGKLLAKGPVNLTAETLNNQGGQLVSTEEAMALAVATTLNNSQQGLLAAKGDLSISAATLDNSAGVIEHAGTGALTLNTPTLVGNKGKIASNGDLQLTGDAMALAGGTTSAKQITIDTGTLDNTGGTLVANHGALQLSARGAVTNKDGKLLAKGPVNLTADALDNRGGQLVSTDEAMALAVATTLDNSHNGLLAAKGDLSVSAVTLDNSEGDIEHAGDGLLTLNATTLQGAQGKIASNGALALTGDDITLVQGSTSAKQITLDTGTLDNTGGELVADSGKLQLTSRGAVTNKDGKLLAKGPMTVTADALNNQGGQLVSADEAMALAVATTLDNSHNGLLAAKGDLSVSAATLDNSAGTIEHAGAGTLTLNTPTLVGNKGKIVSNGTLQLTGDAMTLAEGTTSAKQITLDTGTLDNTGGTLVADSGLLQLTARGAVTNKDGKLLAKGPVTVSADALDNQGGQLVSTEEAMALAVATTLNNSQQGLLAAKGNMGISAATLDNRAGVIEHAGDGSLSLCAATLQGAAGKIASNGALQMKSDDINLAQGATSAKQITMDTGTLDNTGGELVADSGKLQLTSRGAVTNKDGKLLAKGPVTITAETLNNQGGQLVSTEEAMTLAIATTLDNSQQGLLGAKGDLKVTVATLDNREGVIEHAGDGALTINAATLQGAQGKIASNGTLHLTGDALTLAAGTTTAREITIDTGTLDNTSATLVADNGPLQLTARGAVTNKDGKLLAKGPVNVTADALANQGGQLVSTDNATTLNVTTTLDNSRNGLLAAKGDMSISAATLDNNAGAIEHAGDGALTINATTLQGAQGKIASNGALTLTGDQTQLQGAHTQARQIAIDTRTLTTADGKLVATGTGPLHLTVQDKHDNSRGYVASNGALQLHAGQLLNGLGTVLAAGSEASQIDVRALLDNSGGAMVLAGQTTLSSDTLNNRGGKIVVAGEDGLTLSARGQLDNSQQGRVASTGAIHLTSDTLDNRQGTLESGQRMTLKVGSTLDNRAGKLVSANTLGVQAGNLDNREQGLVASSAGSLHLDTTQGSNNAGGVLQAHNTLRVTGASLDNTGGTLVGGEVSVNTRQGALTNTSGVVASKQGALDIASGPLDNSGGLLQSAAALTVDIQGQTLNNSNAGSTGGILSAGALTLRSGDLLNLAGVIHGGGALIAHVGSLDNQSGKITGRDKVDVAGAALDNRAGLVQAEQDLAITLTGAANNQRGLLAAGQALQLRADSLINQDTQGAASSPLGVQGANVTLSAHNIDNRNGEIVADQLLTLTGVDTLDNSQGDIASAGSLAATLGTANNRAGALRAGDALSLAANSLSGDGRVLAKGDLTLSLQQDFINEQEVAANGKADITTAGNLTNRGTLQAGELALQAASIDNQASGQLRGNATRLVASNTLTNRGLIDGSQTRIQAGALDNVGSGRIYGNQLAIAAGTVQNREEGGKAATLAARERLDIGAGTLINREHGMIFSAGDMAIGGALDGNNQANGRAGLVQNDSATIESLGSMSLATGQLLNRNLHFATQEERVAGPTAKIYIQPEGETRKYDESEVRWDSGGYGNYYVVATGQRLERYTKYSVTRTEFATKVQPGSDPAVIRAGGNITLSGDNLTNDKSHILAGGTLQGDLHNLQNVQASGVHLIQEAGSSEFSYTKKARRWTKRSRYNDDPQSYTPADITQTIDLNVAQTTSYSSTGASGYQVAGKSASGMSDSVGGTTLPATATNNGRQIIEVTAQPGASAVPAPTSDLRVAQPNEVQATRVALNQQAEAQDVTSPAEVTGVKVAPLAGDQSHPVALATQATGVAVTPSTHAAAEVVAGAPNPATTRAADVKAAESAVVRTLMADTTVPNSSLFGPGPASGHYLVESDPNFTDYRAWLGSDYMLKQLAIDPALTQKRLGDGFYEQMLVRDQIAQLTGRRFLDSYNNDEAQYRALLDAGITVARNWHLRPGVALSPEQMAQLTSDIVWLVERDVRLADGSVTRALVPQVYVRVKPGDLDGSGTLLSANRIDLKLAGDVANTGTIAGRQLVQLTSDNVRNLGRILGDKVALDARHDIDNIGGTITADTALALSAGRDLNLISTTQSDAKQAGLSDFSRTNMDRVAGLYVTGDNGTLLASAGRDLTLLAAQISNRGSGQTALVAGRDLTLGTVTLAEQENIIANRDNYLRSGYRTEMGSKVSGTGDVLLQAGNDLTARAAGVSSEQGTLAASAQGNMTLLAGESSRNLSEAHKTTSRGLFSSSTTTTRHDLTEQQAVATTFEGKRVTLQGRDVTIAGSNVVSDLQTDVQASHDLTIAAVDEVRRESHFNQTSKSGLFGSGGLGFTIGKQSQSTDQQEGIHSKAGATVGSTQGNVNLTAGNQLNVAGSDLIAGKDMTLSGKDVTIRAEEQQASRDQETRSQSGGLTIALTGGAVTAMQSAYDAAKSAKETDNGRLKALQGAKAAMSGYQAYQESQGMGSANTPDPTFVGIAISVGNSRSQSNSQSSEQSALASELNAGGDVTVQARGDGSNTSGDLVMTGSGIKGNNVTLAAARDLVLQSASNNSQQNGSNRSSGWNVGLSFGFSDGGAGLSVFANMNAAKGKELGSTGRYTQTRVTAGDTLTLKSGQDATLLGAQVSGDKVTADIGRHLTLTSQQDSDHYQSKQSSVSAGGSFTFGTMTGSGYINASRQKINSDFESVQEQTGVFAGKQGFDIRVGEHTQLNGAVLAGSDNPTNNRLSTNTLGWSDIHNQADYKVESQSIGISSNGGIKQGLAGMAAQTLLNGGNSSGSASSTTHAAISNGDIELRSPEKQQQDVTTLLRDPSQAANGLSPIFDKQKELDKLQEIQLIGELGQQATQLVVNEKMGKAEKEVRDNPEYANSKEYKDLQAKWGVGSDFQRGVQAATAALQGLAGGDITQAAAGAASPYLAQLVKQQTTDGPSRILAHALTQGALAAAQNKNAMVGATGAATGELVGIIATELYHKDASELSEGQKETVSTLATLAAGLAGGLTGGDSTNALAGAQTGKTVVENNTLAIPAPTLVPVPGVPVGPGDQVKQDADKKIASGLQGLLDDALDTLDKATQCSFGRACSSEETDSERNPNVGKDLTDEQKQELGGSGSGTPGGWGPEDEQNARDPGQHEKYKDDLRRNMEKPNVKDTELQKIMDNMYRPNAKIGSGSTADAVRHELSTGETVAGKVHIEKAQNYVKGLENWLRNNPNASPNDRAAAENVLKDLQNALSKR